MVLPTLLSATARRRVSTRPAAVKQRTLCPAWQAATLSARRRPSPSSWHRRRRQPRRPVPLWVGGLSHLDQMTVGIADVATDLVLVLFRRRQEFSTPGAPFGVHGLDVFDPDIEEAADPVGIAWRLQDDRRLVVGRASAGIDDDPAVGQRNIGQPSGAGLGQPAAEYFGVEAPGALDIVRDDEVGQHNSLWRWRELGHLAPPLVGLTPRFATGPAAHVTTS